MGDRLKGKICIVTGGNTGIGRRICEVFIEQGAEYVLIAARREKEGQALAQELGPKAEFLQTDVAREEQVERMVKHAVDKHGRIDVLVNNAGCPAPVGSITTIPLDEHDKALSVLIGGVMLGMKHVAPVMLKQGSGSIVNIGSVAAHRAGFSSSTIYSAAKAAVVHLTRCVAMELAEQGIRVNSVSPGAIVTGIFGKAMGLPDDKAEETVAAMQDAFKAAQPMPRSGQPDDIAQAVLYLASDESTFTVGEDIVVDGGMIGGRHWSVQQEAIRNMKQAFGIEM
jgi:NAD(P)-dependent dehydrogenase (short-subunit alcohol dehydrogenase family)